MKIQNITPQKQNNTQESLPQFTGATAVITGGLRFFETNQAWGANAVDLGSMVIPRTWTDMKKRGIQAGTETGIRESCGTFNHSMIGLYGTAAGFFLAKSFNNKFGIKADKIFADNNAISIMTKDLDEVVKEHLDEGKEITVKDGNFTRLAPEIKQKYAQKITEKISTFNNGYRSIADTEKSDVAKTIEEVMSKAEEIKGIKLSKSEKKEAVNFFNEKIDYLTSLISESTGGKERAKLANDKKESFGTLNTTVKNIVNVSRTFVQDKVIDTFKNTQNINDNVFVKGLKTLNLKRSAFGLGFAALFGMSVQPLNRLYTKKRTGNDGFVGVQGRKKDKSKSFAVMKTIAGLMLGTFALSTITTKPSKFLSKLQFKGKTPTINQLKFIYGMTIMSRLFVARDKDELRESAIKDTLGFLNLLVIGSLVTKAAVMAMGKGKNLLNTDEKSTNVFKRFINSTVKTKDEVLIEGLINGTQKAEKKTTASGKALSFSDLMRKLPKEATATRKKLWILNAAQVIGYAYSALVLGIGIPRLNIYMTNKREARNAAKLAAENNSFDEKNNINNDFLKSKMVNFYGNVTN